MTISIQLEFDEERVADLLIAAFEGGSHYWARSPSFHGSLLATVQGTNPVEILDMEDERRLHILDRAAVERGMVAFATKAPRHFATWLNQHEDAETGDVFLQLCIFGEVVYG